VSCLHMTMVIRTEDSWFNFTVGALTQVQDGKTMSVLGYVTHREGGECFEEVPRPKRLQSVLTLTWAGGVRVLHGLVP
jgi:hypothetical protein